MATLEDHNYTKMQLPTNKLGEPVVTSIPEVPVTVQRKPFLQPELDQKLAHTGMQANHVPTAAFIADREAWPRYTESQHCRYL